VNPLRVIHDDPEPDSEDRPTAPPTEPAPGQHQSGVRRKVSPSGEWRPAARRSLSMVAVDPDGVPLVVARPERLFDPRKPIASVLYANINGVLTIADLAEVTGIPLGAAIDAIAELSKAGLVAVQKRAG
jgi:hypothetical protein